MRPIDREEAAAATRIPVLLSLLWGVLFTEVEALYAGGELCAMYGSRNMGSGVGYIWMLSTDAVARHKRDVFEACAEYIDVCAMRYRLLVNAVYAKNYPALGFVSRLGFSIGERVFIRGAEFYAIARSSCVG
jgi:hypothetical protein